MNAERIIERATNLENVLRRLRSVNIEVRAICAKPLTARQRRRLTELSELSGRLQARARDLQTIK
jgi:hypothetical protein